jgi:hypothetical protein
MVNNVEIVGSDLNGAILRNAATEETLKELVRVLTKKGGAGTSSKVNELYEKSIKNNIRAVDTSTNKTNAYNKTLEEVNRRSREFGDTLKTIGGFGFGLIFSTLSSVTSGLISIFTDSIDGFRQTSQVGASFNNDLIELRRTAASASMSLNDFVAVIRDNSQTLAAFGGSVTDGARRFAELSRQLRTGEIGQTLMGMGMTMGDINQYMG